MAIMVDAVEVNRGGIRAARVTCAGVTDSTTLFVATTGTADHEWI